MGVFGVFSALLVMEMLNAVLGVLALALQKADTVVVSRGGRKEMKVLAR